MIRIFQHTQLLAGRIAGIALPRRPAALVGLWGMTLPLPLHAEATATAAVSTLPDAGFSVLRVMGALVFVLALFFGLVWLYRNWQRVLRRHGHVPLLNVLEARSLGNRHSIYVVTCGAERFLIGSSPTGLNLLSQLRFGDTPAAPPEAGSRKPEARPALASFADTLQAMLERK